MFSIITKMEYWDWIAAQGPLDFKLGLKCVQDAFIMSRIGNVQGKKILEVGGGQSRILKTLSANNECWNAEKLNKGDGRVGSRIAAVPNVRTVEQYMGDFSHDIPADYFDYVVSVSVIEHVPLHNIANVFGDCIRVLKPGGFMFHAVDVYLFDPGDDRPKRLERIEAYKLALQNLPAAFIEDPGERINFQSSARWASNPDYVLYSWNRIFPKMTEMRAAAQSASLKIGMQKSLD
jgi:ubiquinone/menaquinone biosynthesis C-methylase UbiE